MSEEERETRSAYTDPDMLSNSETGMSFALSKAKRVETGSGNGDGGGDGGGKKGKKKEKEQKRGTKRQLDRGKQGQALAAEAIESSGQVQAPEEPGTRSASPKSPEPEIEPIENSIETAPAAARPQALSHLDQLRLFARVLGLDIPQIDDEQAVQQKINVRKQEILTEGQNHLLDDLAQLQEQNVAEVHLATQTVITHPEQFAGRDWTLEDVKKSADYIAASERIHKVDAYSRTALAVGAGWEKVRAAQKIQELIEITKAAKRENRRRENKSDRRRDKTGIRGRNQAKLDSGDPAQLLELLDNPKTDENDELFRKASRRLSEIYLTDGSKEARKKLYDLETGRHAVRIRELGLLSEIGKRNLGGEREQFAQLRRLALDPNERNVSRRLEAFDWIVSHQLNLRTALLKKGGPKARGEVTALSKNLANQSEALERLLQTNIGTNQERIRAAQLLRRIVEADQKLPGLTPEQKQAADKKIYGYKHIEASLSGISAEAEEQKSEFLVKVAFIRKAFEQAASERELGLTVGAEANLRDDIQDTYGPAGRKGILRQGREVWKAVEGLNIKQLTKAVRERIAAMTPDEILAHIGKSVEAATTIAGVDTANRELDEALKRKSKQPLKIDEFNRLRQRVTDIRNEIEKKRAAFRPATAARVHPLPPAPTPEPLGTTGGAEGADINPESTMSLEPPASVNLPQVETGAITDVEDQPPQKKLPSRKEQAQQMTGTGRLADAIEDYNARGRAFNQLDEQRPTATKAEIALGGKVEAETRRNVEDQPPHIGREQQEKLDSIMARWEQSARGIYKGDNPDMTDEELDAVIGGLRRSKRNMFTEKIKNVVKK